MRGTSGARARDTGIEDREGAAGEGDTSEFIPPYSTDSSIRRVAASDVRPLKVSCHHNGLSLRAHDGTNLCTGVQSGPVARGPAALTNCPGTGSALR